MANTNNYKMDRRTFLKDGTLGLTGIVLGIDWLSKGAFAGVSDKQFYISDILRGSDTHIYMTKSSVIAPGDIAEVTLLDGHFETKKISEDVAEMDLGEPRFEDRAYQNLPPNDEWYSAIKVEGVGFYIMEGKPEHTILGYPPIAKGTKYERYERKLVDSTEGFALVINEVIPNTISVYGVNIVNGNPERLERLLQVVGMYGLYKELFGTPSKANQYRWEEKSFMESDILIPPTGIQDSGRSNTWGKIKKRTNVPDRRTPSTWGRVKRTR